MIWLRDESGLVLEADASIFMGGVELYVRDERDTAASSLLSAQAMGELLGNRGDTVVPLSARQQRVVDEWMHNHDELAEEAAQQLASS